MLYWELALDKNDPILREELGEHPFIDDRLEITARDADFSTAAKRFGPAVQAAGFDPGHDTIAIRLRCIGCSDKHDHDIVQSWVTWASHSRTDYHPLTQAMLKSLGILAAKEA